MATDFRDRARRLRNAVEPVAAGVYFAREALAPHVGSQSTIDTTAELNGKEA